MQTNVLRAEMVRKGINGQKMSEAIGISESAFYRKMSGATEFTLSELKAIRDTLELSHDDVYNIFFADKVS